MLENECEGGESIIVDGWELVEDLKEDHQIILIHYVTLRCLLENLIKRMKLMQKPL